MEQEAGIRELKTHLSAYLRRVKAGETIVITDRGTPIGRIIPVGTSLDERMERLMRAGLIAWSGKPLEKVAPVARTKGDRTIADLLLEERE